MYKSTIIGLAGVLLPFALAEVAEAHSVSKQFGDFYGGMLHPLTALEHVVPILGLGLLAGQQGAASARRVLVWFPIGLALGTAVGSYMAPSLYVEWFNRLSFVALGAIIASDVRLQPPILATLAIVLGISHGHENTASLSSSTAMHLFIPGVVVTGIATVAIFAAVSVSRAADWQKMAVRVVGSWIMAIGILFIGTMG